MSLCNLRLNNSKLKLRHSQHAPHFLSLPLRTPHWELGAAIYYINLACTPLLLSKISPTLHPTFQMHPTFYIMISPTTHFLLPLLYYRCTPISPVFYILHPTLGAKSKPTKYFKHIYKKTSIVSTKHLFQVLRYIFKNSLT